MSPTAIKPNVGSSALALLYHELRETPAAYSYVLSCSEFEKHLVLFGDLQREHVLHHHPILTFDDGHVSNHQHAMPMLQRHSMKAHFFITAGWTATRAEYMDWTQLRELNAAGHCIGAHGWTHTLLTHCSSSQLDRELRGAREHLEDGLGTTITSLSLPGGRANREVLAACERAGYTTIWTSEPRHESLPLGSTVGRFNIRGDVQVEWLSSLLQPGSGVLAGVRRTHAIKALSKRVLGDRLYMKLWSVLNRQEMEPANTSKDGERT